MPRETTYKFKNTQTVTTSGTTAATTNAVDAQTRVVRLKATQDMHITFGRTPTATTADPLLSAGETEYIDITPLDKVAAIQSSTAGILYVTEVTK